MSADGHIAQVADFPQTIVDVKNGGDNIVRLARSKSDSLWFPDDGEYLKEVDADADWKPAAFNTYSVNDGWYYIIKQSTLYLANIKRRQLKTFTDFITVTFKVHDDQFTLPYLTGTTYGILPEPVARPGWKFWGWNMGNTFLSVNDTVSSMYSAGTNIEIRAVMVPLRCIANGTIITYRRGEARQRHRMFIDGELHKIFPDNTYENVAICGYTSALNDSRWLTVKAKRYVVWLSPSIIVGSSASKAITSFADFNKTGYIDKYTAYNVKTGELKAYAYNSSSSGTINYYKWYLNPALYLLLPPENNGVGQENLVTVTDTKHNSSTAVTVHTNLCENAPYNTRDSVMVDADTGDSLITDSSIDHTTLTARHALILPPDTVMKLYDYSGNIVYQRSFTFSMNSNFNTGILWWYDNKPANMDFSYVMRDPSDKAWCSIGIKECHGGVFKEYIDFTFNPYKYRMAFEYLGT